MLITPAVARVGFAVRFMMSLWFCRETHGPP